MLLIKTTARKFVNIYILFLICSYFVDGFVITKDTYTFLSIVALLTLGQVFIKPILDLATFPFKIVTLGLTEILIDCLLLFIVMKIFSNSLVITTNDLGVTFSNIGIDLFSLNISLNFILNLVFISILMKIVQYITKFIIF